jgi:ferrous iron transport protein B
MIKRLANKGLVTYEQYRVVTLTGKGTAHAQRVIRKYRLLERFLNLFQGWLSPVTVSWLGLPAATGIVLIFDVLRKELTLILLASIIGTTNFALILSPAQMFVFAFVVMIYVPCLATIAVLTREFGVKKTAVISLTEIALAVVLGGVLYRVLLLMGLA